MRLEEQPPLLSSRMMDYVRRIAAMLPSEHRLACIALLMLGGVAYCAHSDQVQLAVIIAMTVIVVFLNQRDHAQTNQGGQDGSP